MRIKKGTSNKYIYYIKPTTAMNILKFGGKSISTPERFDFVTSIVAKKNNSIVIVPSIPEITEKLEEISNYLYKKNVEGGNEIINVLKNRLSEIVFSLSLTDKQEEEAIKYINEKINYIRTFTKDLFTLFEEKIILAQGEIITSYLFFQQLKNKKADVIELSALEFMKIDKNSEPDNEYIKEKLTAILASEKAGIYITQGYICKNVYGEIDDFRKGGNDFSATLIGAAIGAEEIQIWTDNSGMYNIDPEIISEAAIIKELNFDEAAEIAYFGDKILHPSSILPAKLANIPVRILSILTPESNGTLISDKSPKEAIKAIATKDNITAIKINSGKMLLAHGFLRRIFEIFENYCTPIDMLASSEVGVSITIDNNQYINEITDELKRYGTVSVDSSMSIICIIGDLNWQSGLNKIDIFDSLKQLNIRMVSYGGSNHNFSFLIDQKDKIQALEILNKNIFK